MSGEVRSPLRSPSRRPWDVSAVGRDDYLASLTRRLEVLEKKLVGTRGLREDFPPLYPAIKTCQDKLEGSIDSGNQVTLHTLWNKVDTLEKLLNPAFSKTSQISQAAKEDLLLGYVSQVETVSGQVEQLQRLRDYINTTEFQGLDAHEKKLAAVSRTHNQQEQAVEEITRQARDLMKAYDQITLQLSAQCIEWERELGQLESRDDHKLT